ncbi:MAG: hypothetical protein OEY87_08225 [Gammaproteobacteria bacterium]|nr:hypothetical protein [Gammaproteobacteria bacterium]MDH5736094.1 hypothetical protein [Gammaproteobacteria bacterium]
MKLNLVLMALLLMTNLSHADTTLIYKLPDANSEKFLTYYIKDSLLRFKEEGMNKTNVFDPGKQEFTSIDQNTGNISRINDAIVNQHTEKLNKERMEKLKSIEAELNKQLQTMDASKKEVAEVLMNKLKYPEFYGDQAYLNTEKTASSKKINNIECQIYNVRLHEKLMRQICMASIDDLKISADDYTALRSFFKFNYRTQSRMMLAAGKTSFNMIDYDEQNIPGIPIEITVFTDQGSKQEQLLHKISNNSLDKALFEIKHPK